MTTCAAETVVTELAGVVGRKWVRGGPGDLAAYSYDATGSKQLPDLVVFPADTPQVAACLKSAARRGMAVIPRGAGTNVSGGTLPVSGGMVVDLARMNRVKRVDPLARLAVAEAGATNGALQAAAAPFGLFFPPDPSTMLVSTLGGNMAENAGGPHCAKYGVTSNHVLGATVVLADGSVVDIGGESEEPSGLDLLGFLVGSEGTLGVITEGVFRLMRLPRASQTMLAVFGELGAAMAAVSGIVAAYILPAAMEVMDRNLVEVIRAGSDSVLPGNADAVLLIEVDGDPEELDTQAEQIADVCRSHGALDFVLAADEAEREALWVARRSAAGSLARISPAQFAMDVTVPRDRLQEMMEEVVRLADRHRLKVMVGAHAGDGNMHPAIPYDPRDEDMRRRIEDFDWDVQQACLGLGGSITGEHGVGVEKLRGLAAQYSPGLLDLMWAVRTAFDPGLLFNPGKAVVQPVRGM